MKHFLPKITQVSILLMGMLLSGFVEFPSHVFPFDRWTPDIGIQAVEAAEKDEAGENQAAADGENVRKESGNAKDKMQGFLGKIWGVWDGITGWIGDKFGRLRSSLDKMFGFEKGEGPQALFGTAVYVLILIFALFFLKFAYNIVADIFKAIFGGGGGRR